MADPTNDKCQFSGADHNNDSASGGILRRSFLSALTQFSKWPRPFAFGAIVSGSILASFLAVYLMLTLSPNEVAPGVWKQSLIAAALIPAVISSGVAHVLLTMLAALKSAYAKVDHLANTDDLTGLLNRRRFTELAQLALSQDISKSKPTSLILIDVDDFKGINDRFGHAAGDTVLQFLAAICRKNVREGDQIARWGGEEFVILFPSSSSHEALRIAERIRESVCNEKIQIAGQRIPLTISTGLVSRRATVSPTLDTLVSTADQAMYAAKESGKNRVIESLLPAIA